MSSSQTPSSDGLDGRRKSRLATATSRFTPPLEGGRECREIRRASFSGRPSVDANCRSSGTAQGAGGPAAETAAVEKTVTEVETAGTRQVRRDPRPSPGLRNPILGGEVQEGGRTRRLSGLNLLSSFILCGEISYLYGDGIAVTGGIK